MSVADAHQVGPEERSIEKLLEKLAALRQTGSHRIVGEIRNSAYGETLEALLGLSNNSSKQPDWGDYEIKTSVREASNMTLLTLPWNFAEGWDYYSICTSFGKDHFSKHLQCPCKRFDVKIPHSDQPLDSLHYYICDKQNSVKLRHADITIAKISLGDLEKRVKIKLKNMVHVMLRVSESDQTRFNIENITVLRQFSMDRFLKNLLNKSIWVEFQCFLLWPGLPKESLKTGKSTLKCSKKGYFQVYDSVIKL